MPRRSSNASKLGKEKNGSSNNGFEFRNRKQGQLTVNNYKKLERKMSSSSGTGTVEGKMSESYKKLYAKGSQGISLDRVLQSPKSFKLFWDFCIAKDVAEQLKFWIDVERFQNQDWKAARILGLNYNEEKEVRKTRRRSAADYTALKSPRKRVRSRSRSRSASPSRKDATDIKKAYEKSRNAKLKSRAKMIWAKYLDPVQATSEICPRQRILRAKVKLETYNGDRKVFRMAQRHVFRDMEKSIFGRFVSGLDHVQLMELSNYLAIGRSNREDKVTRAMGSPDNILRRDSNVQALATVNALRFTEMQ